MISAAPEIPGGLEFAKNMSSKGIVMSIAHSDATYKETLDAMNCGYSHVTHIFNGNSLLQSPYYYCQIGVCETALLIDEYSVEVIADGKHLPPELLKLIYKIKGPDKVNLITDAMRAAGMGKGVYELGGQVVLVNENSARLENGTLAGSILKLNNALKNFTGNTGLSINEAVKAVSFNPAVLLGIQDEKGKIEKGYAADIVIFDEGFEIQNTFVNGKLCYSK
jgi:N-acetylglucosamine-6-phosphate deacetylase